MINHPQEWSRCVRMTHFCMRICELKKIRHGTPLSKVNNAVDGGPLLLLSMMVNDNDAKAQAPSV